MSGAWLAEDPELLRATLELIDTWGENCDLDGASVSVVSSSSDMTTDSLASSSEGHDSATSDREEPFGTEHEESPDDEAERSRDERPRKKAPLVRSIKTAASPRAAESKLSTNQRRRAEIHMLQDLVRAMEAQIGTLQEGKQALGSVTQSLSLGQQIVENQRRLRRKSELEGAKLRKLLQAHESIAQRMAKLVQKAHAMQEDTVWRSLHLEQTNADTLLCDPRADLFQRVELMYSQLDTVFAHERFHDGSSNFVDMTIHHDLEQEVVLEFRETWTVPFEPLAVLDALWSFTKKRYEMKWNSPGQQVSLNTTDAFMTQFTTQGSIDQFLFSFAGQLLLKRFDNYNAEHMPAIVTNMMSAPNRDSLDGPMQVWMHDHSCTRLIPVIGSRGRWPMTRVQSTYHVSVQFDGTDNVTSRRHAATVANFVLSKLQSDNQVKQTFVETSLLQPRQPIC